MRVTRDVGQSSGRFEQLAAHSLSSMPRAGNASAQGTERRQSPLCQRYTKSKQKPTIRIVTYVHFDDRSRFTFLRSNVALDRPETAAPSAAAKGPSRSSG